MSKLKKMLTVISTVGLLSVSTGSIANDNLGQKSFDSTPAFLQNTGAVMMTDGQMASVQGEAWYNDWGDFKTMARNRFDSWKRIRKFTTPAGIFFLNTSCTGEACWFYV